jgi:DNA-binding PadR family transcriptional regulator
MGDDLRAPLKPLDFLILVALSGGARHGYGIRGDIAELTGNDVVVDAGNLYRSIRRLLESGLLERSTRRSGAQDDDDERRVYYRLTAEGRRAAATEARRMRGLLRHENVRKLLGEGRS